MAKFKVLFWGVFLITYMIVGCAKNSSDGSSPSPQETTPKSGNDENQKSLNPTTELKVYEGLSPAFNDFQAVNVNAGKLNFDFSYKAQQDAALILNLAGVKSTLLGCDDSNIKLYFNLYRMGTDGKIDMSSNDGLGPSPSRVEKGVQYVLRAELDLDKSCLAIRYNFSIQKIP